MLPPHASPADECSRISSLVKALCASRPGLRVDVKLTVANGDMVACLMEYRGAHATFKREAIWRETWFARLSDGKIVESWPLPDIDAYCRQLGNQHTPPST